MFLLFCVTGVPECVVVLIDEFISFTLVMVWFQATVKKLILNLNPLQA